MNSGTPYERLRNASPLDLPKAIIDTELYDEQKAKDLFDEVNENFNRDNMESNVIMPVFTTMLDSILDLKCFHGITKKLGLTSNRVIIECKNFNYDGNASYLIPDSFAENRNQQETNSKWGEQNRPEYDRGKYEDPSMMGQYKNKKVKENGTRKNLPDEYTQKKNITRFKNDGDARRNDPKHLYNAETDHIIPLKRIFDEVQNNAGLSDEDIKRIANQDYNFAVTSRKINNAKRELTNSEFIRRQEELKAEGKPYIELSDEQKENMIQMEENAHKEVDKSINKTVLKNLSGLGEADRQKREEATKRAFAEEEKRLGRKLTGEEKSEIHTKITKQLSKEKAANIHISNAKNAGKQSLMYIMGNVLLLVIKPLYFEIKDGFVNGFKKGVNASTYKEAFSIRFVRVKDYVWKQLKDIKTELGNVLDFIKNFISALIEGIIGMFVGVFKQILRVLKEGIKAFMNAWPILFGKNSNTMTAAQKGDAIVKILGGSAVALCGIGIDALLEKIGLPEMIRGAISTLLSGLASVLMFYVLDKADLFNVKADLRNQRINEIFQARIDDIRERTCNFQQAALETLRDQKLKFKEIESSFNKEVLSGNFNAINNKLNELENFLGITTYVPRKSKETMIHL